MKYIHRGRGVVLLHNGRQYFKKKTYKNGARWWRCCKSISTVKCTGSVTIKHEDEILKETTYIAGCVMDVAKNEWAEQMEACKQKVMSTDQPVPKIYEEAMENFENTGYDIVHEVPSFEQIKVGLYKMRNKVLSVPKVSFYNSDDISNIVIPRKFNDFLLADFNPGDSRRIVLFATKKSIELMETINDYFGDGTFKCCVIPRKFNDFLLADFNPGDSRRIVLFATKKSIELMETINDYFGDGTFKCCVPPFSQIYTIHGDCGSSLNTTNIRPLVYALMSHRDTDAYRILFDMLKSQVNGWRPVKYTCDFEKSTIKALRSTFTEITINGCYYHFQQSLIKLKKAKSLKIFNAKNNRRCVFLCRSLALLPHDKITAGWEYIEQQFNKHTHLQPFLRYLKKIWQCPENIKLWSIFGERHRTNNYVESFHTTLSKRIKKLNRTLLDLIAAFKKNADYKRTPKQRRSSIQLNEFICEAQLSVLDGHITVGHFLEMVR